MRFQCKSCKGIVAVPNKDLGIKSQCGHCGEMVTVPKSRLVNGAVIADFIILKRLNTGKTEVTYLAHQMTVDREVLLKVLKGKPAKDTENVVEFIKEIRKKAKNPDPQPCEPIAVGEDEGIFYQAYKLHRNKRELNKILKSEIKG